MPRSIRVIRGRDFIRAQPEGRVNLEGAQRMLRDIADAGAEHAELDVLVDVRHVVGEMLTPAELWLLAETVATYRRKLGRRTAILCPLERFDNARFFALCAEHRGVNVHAFTSYEGAMEWLIADEG